ncbi:MAG: YiiX/YebB-like N1pC/P60 family cysteine hydrolase [Candidatus Brocadiales bacterium]|nr:YiiX/YebB-like N1pC/P60 family cysteine hydrolase [Candidatus Brocadiales bacterium]
MGTAKFDRVASYRYDTIKNEIKTGDILFCSGNYYFSKIVSILSNSLFTHVAIAFWRNKQIFLLECEISIGVRIVPFSEYVRNYNNTNKPYDGDLFLGPHEITNDHTKAELLIDYAMRFLNRRFDNTTLARILLRIVTKIGRYKEKDAYICSDFVEKCFRIIGVQFPRDPGGFVFPEHIASDPGVEPLFRIIK